MAHAGLTVPEGSAINAFSSISTEHISSSQTTFQCNIEMPITRSPSPSQPRASWSRTIRHGRISSPTIPNEDLSSRDSSQSRNYTHTPFDWGTRLERTSRSKHPYFDERYADALRSDHATPSQREASSTPPGEPGQKITPASTIASVRYVTTTKDQVWQIVDFPE